MNPPTTYAFASEASSGLGKDVIMNSLSLRRTFVGSGMLMCCPRLYLQQPLEGLDACGAVPAIGFLVKACDDIRHS